MVRLASDAIRDGVGTVNLVSPRWVYEELFSFTGLGTLFTPAAVRYRLAHLDR